MVYRYNPDAQHEPLSTNRFEIRASITSERIKALQKETQMDVDFINERMAYYYNQRHGKEPELKKGDKVYLLQKNIQTDRPNQKLDFKKLGPYRSSPRKTDLITKLRSQTIKTFLMSFTSHCWNPHQKMSALQPRYNLTSSTLTTTMTMIKNGKSKRFSIHDTTMVYYSTKYTGKAMTSRTLLGNP